MKLNFFDLINIVCYLLIFVILIFYSYKLNNISVPIHSRANFIYSMILSSLIFISFGFNFYMLQTRELNQNYRNLIRVLTYFVSPIMILFVLYKDDLLILDFDYIYSSDDLVDLRGVNKNDSKNIKLRKETAEREYFIRSEMNQGIYN